MHTIALVVLKCNVYCYAPLRFLVSFTYTLINNHIMQIEIVYKLVNIPSCWVIWFKLFVVTREEQKIFLCNHLMSLQLRNSGSAYLMVSSGNLASVRNNHGCVHKPRVDCSCFEIPKFPKVNNLFLFVYFRWNMLRIWECQSLKELGWLDFFLSPRQLDGCFSARFRIWNSSTDYTCTSFRFSLLDLQPFSVLCLVTMQVLSPTRWCLDFSMDVSWVRLRWLLLM